MLPRGRPERLQELQWATAVPIVSGVLTLDDIAAALAGHEPALIPAAGKRQAAVAMILRDGTTRRGPDVLLIERARHEADPWSGHMAFPGGRVESDDPHTRAAAERETLEEVGLALAGARHLGRLDDMPGRGAAHEDGLVISAHVYYLGVGGAVASDPDSLVLAPREVQQAFWFPLGDLHDPVRHVEHSYPNAPTDFPGILVGEPGRHVVWGLTYRFMEVFFGIVGRPLPQRWSIDRDALMSK